jgi:excisionase family DNA binding protein
VTSLLTLEDVAERLGVTKDWVWAQARAERIPHVQVGRYRRFGEDACMAVDPFLLIRWDGTSPALALPATVGLAWRLEELGPDVEDPDGFLSDHELYERGYRWCESYSTVVELPAAVERQVAHS